MSHGRLSAALLALLVVLATALAGVAPAAAAGSSTSGEIFAPSVAEDMSWWGSWKPSEEVVRYGVKGYPGWVVKYEEGHAGDLEAWANSSTSRDVRAHHEGANVMVVSAPTSAVGIGYWPFGGSDLRDLSYVERIGVNRRVSVDPITSTELRDKGAWERPSGGWIATLGGTSGSFDADGAAWSSEVNESSLQDARADVGADRVNVNGSGVTVAILDTGLNYDEEIHGDRVTGAYNAIMDERVNVSDPSNVTATMLEPVADGSSSRHGSWVATAIAGNGSGENATGVAPGASIVPVKVLGDDGSGSTSSIARGLEYACGEANADVISMSLGSAVPSVAIEEEISDCLEEDGVSAVVVAAGNNRLTYRYVSSPGDSTSSVITVAATDGKTLNESESAYFSAVGPDPETGEGVDVAAPGMSITAELADGNKTLSGTSMATPLVSGTIALTLEANPELVGDAEGLKAHLEETSEAMPMAGVTEVGNGRVSAYNAVNDVVPEDDQEGTRNDEAEARDTANEALAGSAFRELVD